jgi:hypothetical protein
MSQSFSKFLVEKLGLARVVALVSSRDPEGALRRLSGRSVDDWKADWLRTLPTGAV